MDYGYKTDVFQDSIGMLFPQGMRFFRMTLHSTEDWNIVTGWNQCSTLVVDPPVVEVTEGMIWPDIEALFESFGFSKCIGDV